MLRGSIQYTVLALHGFNLVEIAVVEIAFIFTGIGLTFFVEIDFGRWNRNELVEFFVFLGKTVNG